MAILESDLDFQQSLFQPEVPACPVDAPPDGRSFHPAVQLWFDRRFPDGPTAPQADAWPHIAAGRNTLVAAPTGSGKTLAGFLMCIDRLYRDHMAGRAVSTVARVVYVSPLKALAVDIAQNLTRPLEEIAIVAAELGMSSPDLRVGVRTGDTTSSERAKMLRKPPAFVITTPESLYLLLTARKSRGILRTVDTVIVDEIHAAARDKRGSHLALTLERLDHVTKSPLVRVGLSATQRPIEEIAELLVGVPVEGTDRPAPACEIVNSGHKRALDLAIEIPDGDLEAVASAEQMSDVLARIAEHVREHRTTIIFVNTRRMAERLAHQLEEILEGPGAMGEGPVGDAEPHPDGGPDSASRVAAHHGSLSKDRRLRVETRLRAGELKALVATASLELGIDIGPVELVCQIGSPRSIATFLQRVGRANHHRLGTPKGRLYPMTRDELIECTALLTAVHGGRLDKIIQPELPLDILAQQIVAEVAGQDEDDKKGAGDAEGTSVDALFDLVRQARPFRHLTRELFDETVELVSHGVTTGRGQRGAWLHHDAINGELRPRKGARLVALTSGGAIPEIGDFRVLAAPDDTFIGSVNEEWAVESMAGDIFLLGTHSWMIRRIEPGVVRVVDAGGAPPSVPFWAGEAPARTFELSEEISSLRSKVDDAVALGRPEQAKQRIAADAQIDDSLASIIVDYLAVGRAVLGVMPTLTDLVFERFFDQTGGMQLVVHSPYGARVNRALGLALRKRFCVSFNFELQAAATDDALVISLGPHHSFPLEDVPRFLHSNTVEEVLRQAVLDAPMFQSRWRWNLNRALLVLRFRGGKKNPPAFQRMEADDFLAALFPGAAACQENITGPIEIPEHLVVRQTIYDTLHEGLDVDGLRDLLHDIETGAVQVHCRDTTEASPLAHEILTAKPYAFLDEAEAGDRRTNAVPIRRGLPADPSSMGKLDPAAIDQVIAEVLPDPRNVDELHDLLFQSLVHPVVDRWSSDFAKLLGRGRVETVEAKGATWWLAAENAERVRTLLARVDGEDQSGDDEAAADATISDMLHGHLDMRGPTTEAALAQMLPLADRHVSMGMLSLEQRGIALRGQFTTGTTGDTEWCARRLLARMHSYSRQRRRRSIEPVSAQDFMRFLLAWQHVQPGSQLRGQFGLLEVLEQLQGSEVAASAWESEVLRRRLHSFDPGWLDQLCHRGELGWLRLRPGVQRCSGSPNARGAAPSKATPISLVFRNDLAWLLAAVRRPPILPRRTGGDGISETAEIGPPVGALREVLDALAARGASFLGELVTETGRLPSDVERALWEGVAAGLVTADGFNALRSLMDGARRRRSTSSRMSRLRRGVPDPSQAAGRWSLVPPVDLTLEPDDLAEAVAEQLLNRWGVVFRDLVQHEKLGISWREIQWALRRLEDRGLVRGGRFVTGFGGEQFALPRASDALRKVRDSERTQLRVSVSACDPLNLTGVLFEGARVPAVRTNTVVYVDGLPDAEV